MLKSEHEIIEALLPRINLPRSWNASYLAVSAPDADWIEIRFPDGELWKLTVERVKP